MSPHRTRLGAALLAMIGLVTMLAFSAGTATAAPPATNTATAAGGSHVRPNDNWWACGPTYSPGSQCDNTDPYDTNCASTGIHEMSADVTFTSGTWRAELYYSTACGTVWARLQLLSGTNACPDCVLSVARYNYKDDPYDSLSVGGWNTTLYNGAWTNQLYVPCGGSLKSDAGVEDLVHGDYAWTYDWYPGC